MLTVNDFKAAMLSYGGINGVRVVLVSYAIQMTQQGRGDRSLKRHKPSTQLPLQECVCVCVCVCYQNKVISKTGRHERDTRPCHPSFLHEYKGP